MSPCPICGGYGRTLGHKQSGEWVLFCKTLSGKGCGHEFPLDQEAQALKKIVEKAKFYDPEECVALICQQEDES